MSTLRFQQFSHVSSVIIHSEMWRNANDLKWKLLITVFPYGTLKPDTWMSREWNDFQMYNETRSSNVISKLYLRRFLYDFYLPFQKWTKIKTRYDQNIKSQEGEKVQQDDRSRRSRIYISKAKSTLWHTAHSEAFILLFSPLSKFQ